MNCPSTFAIGLLEEWRVGRDFLLVVLEAAEGRFDLRTGGFVKDISVDEMVLGVENSGELRLRLESVNFTYLDASDAPEEIRDEITAMLSRSLQIRFPGFRLSLSLLRNQPIIRYPEE